MSAVLGVSVGTSAVRMATLSGVGQHSGGIPGFGAEAVEVVSGPVEDVAAQSIGVLLEHEQHAGIGVTGVAFGSGVRADSMHVAMARQRLENYHLVPEVTAVVTLLESVGQLGPADHTLVLYDLGSAGVTVSVVDRDTRTVLAQHRSDAVGGDRFDALIAEQQLAERGLTRPVDSWAAAEFTARCREAKEQLSTGAAACVPAESGLILLNRERFEALVRVPIEGSARLAREVVAASGRQPDVLVLLGGGARIPLVQSLLQGWLGLRTILPPEPEMAAAQGAALLATTMVPQPRVPEAVVPEPDWAELTTPAPSLRGPSGRHLAVAGAVAAGLVVVAGIGLALGRGGSNADQGEPAVAEVTVAPTLPPTTTVAPLPTTTAPPVVVEPEPAPQRPAETPASPEPPAPRYLNLPDPIQIEIPPGIQLPPGMVR